MLLFWLLLEYQNRTKKRNVPKNLTVFCDRSLQCSFLEMVLQKWKDDKLNNLFDGHVLPYRELCSWSSKVKNNLNFLPYRNLNNGGLKRTVCVLGNSTAIIFLITQHWSIFVSIRGGGKLWIGLVMKGCLKIQFCPITCQKSVFSSS